MVPYLIFYLVVFLLSFKIKKRKFTLYDYLLLGIIVLFSGLRYGIGTDYHLYNGMYDMPESLLIGTKRTGVGFYYLSVFFKQVLHMDFKAFIFFISFITNTLYYTYIKKYTKTPGRTILIYIAIGLYGFTFNGFRQGLSIILFLFGLSFLQKKKYLPSAIILLCSCLIHSSSLLGVVFALLFTILPKLRIKLYYVLPLVIGLFIFYDKIFAFVLGLFNSYNMYLHDSNMYAAGIGTIINALIYIVLMVILYSNRNILTEYNKENKLYINFAIIGTVFMVFATKNWLLARIGYQFIIFFPFLISSYYDIKHIGNKKIGSLLFHVMIFAYFVTHTVMYNDLIPYVTVFS